LLVLGLLRRRSVVADAQTAKYREAAGACRAGEGRQLPAVDQACPEQPLLVPVEAVGSNTALCVARSSGPPTPYNYGSAWSSTAVPLLARCGKIEPKIAPVPNPRPTSRAWTISLRKGAKWSDGAPFTADDILFWYKDVLLNKDLTPTLPGGCQTPTGLAVVVEKAGDHAVKSCSRNRDLVPDGPGRCDGGDRTYAAFLPRTI